MGAAKKRGGIGVLVLIFRYAAAQQAIRGLFGFRVLP